MPNKLQQSEGSSFKLDIPYKSQLDNKYNPAGACNVTSVAMCLAFCGIEPSNSEVQLEDELYRYATIKGYNRHSPTDLALIAKDYGIQDDFTILGTFDRCKQHISTGMPCIIHGYLHLLDTLLFS